MLIEEKAAQRSVINTVSPAIVAVGDYVLDAGQRDRASPTFTAFSANRRKQCG
ncbi:hypothetical protein [Rhizobium sp. Root482]|uniref:hypothetical protein n=1 Tax=Rhizobium sp. Root482 TaxID=1736543 RepID=UPI0012E39F05|nr:hypothetical protein [Rhizobium sp. Root482]